MSTQIDLLKKYGLSIRGYSGQHILIDPNIQKKIVESLNPLPKDNILEIGPGLGALTEEILKRGCRVITVEKDKRFVEILKGEFGKDYRKQLEVIHADILDLKLDRLRPSRGKASWKVISNLPYYITAPILFHLIRYRRCLSIAVLTMQKEVAARILAPPGSKNYSRLTLAIRYAADAKHLFDISPSCFSPKPEVNSSVLEFIFHTDSQLPENVDEALLFSLIRLAFSQRRKTLFHLLTHHAEVKISRAEAQALFQTMGWNLSVRGENLLLKDFLAMAQNIESLKGPAAGKKS